MNSRIEGSMDRIADRARGRYLSFLHGARSQTEQAADRVRDGKKPVRTLSKLGVELTSISHRATTEVVRKQARMIENQMDALAGRLHTAARANSLRGLVRDQIRLIPANASQFIDDTRQTFSVVADAGSDVRELLVGTVSELRSSRAKPVKKAKKAAKNVEKAAEKATKKVAKKVAKKPVAKKAPAKAPKKTAKKAARKVSRKASATPKTTAAPKPTAAPVTKPRTAPVTRSTTATPPKTTDKSKGGSK